MKDDNIYIKENGRYKPIGLAFDKEWLTDGVWLVRSGFGRRSLTNGSYLAKMYGLLKVGEPSHVDFSRMYAAEEYRERISDIIGRNYDKSADELAYIITKELFGINDKGLEICGKTER